jgi:hypothetical protein
VGPAKFIWTATAWRSDGRVTLAFVSKPLLVNSATSVAEDQAKVPKRSDLVTSKTADVFQRLRSNGAEVRHWDSDSKSRLEHTGPAGRGLRGRIWHDHRPGVIQSNKQPATSVPPSSVPEDFNPLPPSLCLGQTIFLRLPLCVSYSVRFLFRAVPGAATVVCFFASRSAGVTWQQPPRPCFAIRSRSA